jgi:hypothetical protein
MTAITRGYDDFNIAYLFTMQVDFAFLKNPSCEVLSQGLPVTMSVLTHFLFVRIESEDCIGLLLRDHQSSMLVSSVQLGLTLTRTDSVQPDAVLLCTTTAIIPYN